MHTVTFSRLFLEMTTAAESNPREILHLHIGTAGVEIGHQCWQLYALEHHLTNDGESTDETPPVCFYSEKNQNQKTLYHPRALFIDRIESTEGDLLIDRIQKQVENDDNFQGFIISHPTEGRSCRFTSKLLEELATHYASKTIVTNSIFDTSIDVSCMYHVLKYAHVVIPMENPTIVDLCKQRLELTTPTYTDINRLIALCWSHITCSLRFDGCLLGELNEFQTSLVPFPTLNIISPFLSPLIPYSRSLNSTFQSPSVYDMCVPLFSQAHAGFVQQQIPYKLALATALLFRGEHIIPKEIGQKLIMEMKQWWRFSDQSPTGFRCGINYHCPFIFNNDSNVALTDKQVCALVNEVMGSKYLCNRGLNNFKTNEQTEEWEYLHKLKEEYSQLAENIITATSLDLSVPFG